MSAMNSMDAALLPAPRSWKRAMWNGFTCRCPACGTGRLFSSYAKVKPVCDSCATELHHQRADDAPPYFTMFAVGHVVVPLLLLVEKIWHPALWVHFALWLPLTTLLSLWLLPRVKGAIVGLQWAFGMHGFASTTESEPGTAARATPRIPAGAAPDAPTVAP